MTFPCGQITLPTSTTFYVKPTAGSDSTCTSQTTSQCVTIKQALSKTQASGKPPFSVQLTGGDYTVLEGISVVASSHPLSIGAVAQAIVNYKLTKADVNYFSVSTGSLTISKITLVPTTDVVYTVSPIVVTGGSLGLLGVKVTGYTGRASLISFSGTALTINGGSFKNIQVDASSGGVLSATVSINDRIRIDDTIFDECKITGTNSYGGAIYVYSGNTDIKSCIFKKCSAESRGGAIFCNTADGSIIITHCTFEDNACTGSQDVYINSAENATLSTNRVKECKDDSISPTELRDWLCYSQEILTPGSAVYVRSNGAGTDQSCTKYTKTSCKTL